ncbi:class III extradiol dioxygenase family protein [Rhodoferax sp.]|uniref:class III extradiol dioxygenase family protein n=1 Tax=Rhodoferax sp. TaxID=50421 RepID=UPI002606692B|nr:class III extradiol dioxygenase family protein [Rhodoferax sp.]MDD2924650.1 class III extradiol dioxygenase family protein [Rhodoferax sp.]
MGVLIGGIGSSHAPSISHAFDAGHQDRPEWKPFFAAYAPVKQWLVDQRVDTLVVFYNDHLNHFQFGAYPTFSLGVAESMPVADEGAGPRAFAPVPGDADLGWHLATSLVRDEFDPTICQEMALDHGIMSVLPLLVTLPWSIKVVPININVLREPLPTPARCYRLGQSVGKAIGNFGQDTRVVVMSTGGLSHQLHGLDCGFTNPEWDNRFMDLLEHQPEVLSQASHADFIHRGGVESVEMMIWLAMRGALGHCDKPFKRIQRHYWAPMMTGYGLLALEVPS